VTENIRRHETHATVAVVDARFDHRIGREPSGDHQ
jgi:hypothetical protein